MMFILLLYIFDTAEIDILLQNKKLATQKTFVIFGDDTSLCAWIHFFSFRTTLNDFSSHSISTVRSPVHGRSQMRNLHSFRWFSWIISTTTWYTIPATTCLWALTSLPNMNVGEFSWAPSSASDSTTFNSMSAKSLASTSVRPPQTWADIST